MSCISTVNFAVLVNGTPTSFFNASRGIRQGCPLSPLLFILVIEGLSLMIKDARDNGLIRGIKFSPSLTLTHLLFVDDVILLGSGTILDWLAFESLLDCFCKASGMCINADKSCLLFHNFSDACLVDFKAAMPYNILPLQLGITYLGYQLKPLSYRVADWNWLLNKFEKKIKHWAFRYLSLGGRLVLVNSVLASIPVYWMGLAPIPCSILQKLRKLMFNFLWGSTDTSFKFHLTKWNDISRPKSQGGWGIKDLTCFNKALRLNVFWKALHSKGLWFQVLQAKYLNGKSVVDWIRSKDFCTRNISLFWRGFLQVLPWMGKHLSWQIGNGECILLGLDPFVGLGSSFAFPEELRSYLVDLDICTLAHARNFCSIEPQYWYSATDLDLAGTYSLIWDDYIRELSASGIRLTDSPDKLAWTFNKSSIDISAKEAYNCIYQSSMAGDIMVDCPPVWHKSLPLKISCFIWLAFHNRILTWDNLQR